MPTPTHVLAMRIDTLVGWITARSAVVLPEGLRVRRKNATIT
jgi:hypothetical protein